jgi:hypothetical protein
LAEVSSLRPVVVGSVCGHAVGPATWSTRSPGDCGDAVDQREQLGAVVAVAASHLPGERNPVRVYEKVVLGAGSAAINWARARRGAPFFACT